MKIDLLVFAAHPDDAELGCGGTIANLTATGKKVGIIDLTEGEMSTRGNRDTRRAEAAVATEILGVSVRENLGLKDVFFKNDWPQQEQIIRMIRRYRPELIIANALADRHPDHGRASGLVEQAVFMAGLKKIETFDGPEIQVPYRPLIVYHYIQNDYIEPDIIVDVTAGWDKKVAAIRAFQSQFHDPDSHEPETFISNPEFLNFIEARSREFGHRIGVEHGEGFTSNKKPGVKDLFDLI
jgi:bacillithiol biosynthesis deacetylase BshB1